MRARLVFFALFLGGAVAMHLPWLDMAPHWDEIGWFLPAALDLYQAGHWIPVSTPPSPHPPAVPAYLAAVWTATGYGIPATRVAMTLFGGALLYATFLLAIRLCRGVRGAPAFVAVILLALSPLFHTQAMMVHLDLPAALCTTAALVLFLDNRIAAAAAVCCLLVLVKETGIAVPFVFGGWLLIERRYREAAWFWLAAGVLGAWFAALHAATGHWLGSAEFADYNASYPLHPFRLAAALVRRVYALAIADFHWIGALAVIVNRRLFASREWRIAAALGAVHVLTVCALGGAHLERYLLPVWPIIFVAAAAALSELAPRMRNVAVAAMACGLLAGWWVPPPYPYPYENNLGVATFTGLHRTAAAYLERRHTGARIATAWPLSDALSRTAFGYVRRPMRVVTLRDFHAASFPESGFDVLVLYSHEWEPGYNWMRAPWIEALWRRYFGYERPPSAGEVASRTGLRREARWESRGQWIEILTASAPLP